MFATAESTRPGQATGITESETLYNPVSGKT